MTNNTQWRRDKIGCVKNHIIGKKNQGYITAAKWLNEYTWGINDQLLDAKDPLGGIINYEYDKQGSLSKTIFSDGTQQLRNPDATGNLFTTADRKDKQYGNGGRLLESKNAKYKYDEEGNLIEKKCKNGDTWKYEWNGAGMLQKVIRPDKYEVGFAYDAFGRRVWKKYRSTTTQWLWDGNKPHALHTEIPR